MIKTIFKKSTLIASIAALSMAAFGTTASAVDLTVYTAVEAEDLARYAETFNKVSALMVKIFPILLVFLAIAGIGFLAFKYFRS